MSRLNSFWNFKEDFRDKMDSIDKREKSYDDKKPLEKQKPSELEQKELVYKRPIFEDQRSFVSFSSDTSSNIKPVEKKELPKKETVTAMTEQTRVSNPFADPNMPLSAFKFREAYDNIDGAVNTPISASVKVDNVESVPQSTSVPDPELAQDRKCGLRDLALGDKVELSNGNIVYFIKMLTDKSIWVTDKEADRYNPKATGWSMYVTLGAEFDVKEDTDVKEDVEVKEDLTQDIKLIDKTTQKEVDSSVKDLFKIIDTQLKKINKIGNIPSENIVRYKIQTVLEFAIDLFENVNNHSFAQDLSSYAQEYFQTQYNMKHSFVVAFDSPVSKLSNDVNRKIGYDVNTAIYIAYQSLMKLMPDTGAIVKKFVELDTKHTVDDEEGFDESASVSENKVVNEDYMSVANEIRKQLYTGGINSIGAYFGANSFVGGQDKPKSKEEMVTYEGTEWAKDEFMSKGNLGYLMFKAKGSKMSKGIKIKIALNGMDYYDITIYRINSGDFKIIAQFEDVSTEGIFDILKDTIG